MASSGCHGEGDKCSCHLKLKSVLGKYFGHSSFRQGQLEASLSVLHGHDVFVRMATGSGKSLCMFLAPLAKSDKAIGIVFSPLNGLMEQQVQILHKAKIPAIQAGVSDAQYEDVSSGKYRFVFMSPEVGVLCPWRNIFQTSVFKQHLALVAIDEAHCISEWGADFRTAFRSIGGLRALAGVPFMALSASAPSDTTRDIIASLHLKSPVFVSHSLDRPNIFMSISKSKGLARDIADLAEVLGDDKEIPKTIIFCRTKNDCCKVYHLLSRSDHRNVVTMFHSSLTPATKTYVQDSFKCGVKLRCLCATIAFGMGMDIPDVELVVIYGLPDTMSQLYQVLLCGRAGRDGCQSRAHVLVTTSTDKIRDSALKAFCSDQENCLRSSMITALGDSAQSNPLCCIVCNPAAFSDGEKLDILKIGKVVRKKRRVAVRKMGKQETSLIKLKLEMERSKFLSEHQTLGILGLQFVCPDSVIQTICDSAKFISVREDMEVFCLHQELKEPFFNILMTVINQSC